MKSHLHTYNNCIYLFIYLFIVVQKQVLELETRQSPSECNENHHGIVRNEYASSSFSEKEHQSQPQIRKIFKLMYAIFQLICVWDGLF